jgi:hypothetical protein
MKMRAKIFVLFVLSFLCWSMQVKAASFLCPTAEQIKAGNFMGWQALNVEDDEKIPFDKAFHYFQVNHPRNFWVAQWISDLPLQAQCYYCINAGCQSDGGGFSEIYLARLDASKPVGGQWQDIPPDDKQCKSATVELCPFAALS